MRTTYACFIQFDSGFRELRKQLLLALAANTDSPRHKAATKASHINVGNGRIGWDSRRNNVFHLRRSSICPGHT